VTTDCFPHLTNMLSAGGEGGDWQLVTFHSKYTASRHKQTGFTLDLVEPKVTTNIANHSIVQNGRHTDRKIVTATSQHCSQHDVRI